MREQRVVLGLEVGKGCGGLKSLVSELAMRLALCSADWGRVFEFEIASTRRKFKMKR